MSKSQSSSLTVSFNRNPYSNIFTPYDSQKIKAFKIIFLRKVSETGHFTAANELLLCFVAMAMSGKTEAYVSVSFHISHLKLFDQL